MYEIIEVGIINTLIDKYLDGKASKEEIDQVDEWYRSFDAKPACYRPDTLQLSETLAKGLSAVKLKLGIN